MDPLPSTTIPALPGATADPGLRGRFPEAPEGGGARVQDRDGFETALQAAGVAGSFLLTAGCALSSRVKAEDPPGAAVPSPPGSARGAGPLPPAPPAASNLEPGAFLTPMETLSSSVAHGAHGNDAARVASAMLATSGGIGGGGGAAGAAAKTRGSSGASGDPVAGTENELVTAAVPTVTGAARVSHDSPGAFISPAGAASALQAAGGDRASDVVDSSSSRWIISNGGPLIDVAGKIIDASGRVVGVIGLDGSGSLPTAGSVPAGAGAGSATPGGATAVATPRAGGAVANASSVLDLGAAPSIAPEPGIAFSPSSVRASRTTRPGAAMASVFGSASGPTRSGAAPVSALVSAVGLVAGPTVDSGSPAPAPVPVPQGQAVISSAGGPGVDGAASTLGASAVAAAAKAPAVDAPTLRASMPSLGRALELANPVTLPNLPTAVPHAVNLALREGVREARIRLWPPELGGILVRLRINGTEVTARIEAERMDVRGLLESMRSDLGRGMQEAGLKLIRLEIGPVRPNESLRAWEAAIPASAASPGGGGGTQDRQGQGAVAGNPGQSGGFNQGDPGPRGEHAAGGRAGNGREGAGLGPESRSERGEAGFVARGARGEAAIDAWA